MSAPGGAKDWGSVQGVGGVEVGTVACWVVPEIGAKPACDFDPFAQFSMFRPHGVLNRDRHKRLAPPPTSQHLETDPWQCV